jgi:hypothetical protein
LAAAKNEMRVMRRCIESGYTQVIDLAALANLRTFTETSWDSVTIAWDNGQVASVHHGDMREIERVPNKLHAVQRHP